MLVFLMCEHISVFIIDFRFMQLIHWPASRNTGNEMSVCYKNIRLLYTSTRTKTNLTMLNIYFKLNLSGAVAVLSQTASCCMSMVILFSKVIFVPNTLHNQGRILAPIPQLTN